MKDIVVVGSGGFAKEVAFLIDEINNVKKKWNFLGFIDENVGEYNGKYQIFQNDQWLINTTKEINLVVGIGNSTLIQRISEKFSINSHIKYPNLIHPNVIGDWDRIELGSGNIICAGNIFTTDIKIGSFNIINLDCTIGHDSIIGNYNVINPSVNISGGCKISSCNLIGTGSQILQYLEIKPDQVIIGAGSIVTKDIKENGIYLGVPAKKVINK